jgi:putative N-acetylmannosamine-6-phosphate epimerase
MKIRSGGGYGNLANINRASEAKETKGTKGGKKSGKASSTAEVATPTAVAPTDELNSPIEDELVSAAQQVDEEALEEATKTVVMAVIREQFGKKGLGEDEMQAITNAVSSSINQDETLRGRLEHVLKRISNQQKRKNK